MPALQSSPVTAYVAVGANLGDARQTVLDSLAALAQLPATVCTGRSRLYRTAPHEAQGPDFINAVARLSTRLCAPDLLDALQALENDAGRLRPYRHAPRTLDLDVLLYGDAQIDSSRLTVPHPRMWGRAFVLYPLADLAPDLVTAAHWTGVAGQKIEPLSESMS
ncbi:2-amino-4-hydroxy-6-hydroxymethyldihydropteridine diphosphokinase [Limnohabitans sp. T6-5]|uniref:2-amino-4-hydroxy-6- hydroxymethyldihydropteridine diphosphokinase n=1 Tax=Limnohabitans sp. T6-5 TaxID=1100724 RepID=UPI000D3835EE|nr:2-amino-4-hydroxy-6-hydroxymethyldihydropteridine diphosphokinase [Limnohabitans sp. T6-5]PUE11283.1 2-amino-4-hydroxy-6-hydroxymethyldihydropteridine diphosphokinase [Limnohabitans sp. T6-5]